MESFVLASKLPPGVLSASAIKHLQRLGATYTPRENPEQVTVDGKVLPEPIRQFYQDVTWPKGVSYKNDDNARVWVWMFEPGMFYREGMEEFGFCKSHPGMFVIGIADGGNYYVLLDTNSKPENPNIYKLDSDSSDGGGNYASGPMNLSYFLSTLQVEE